MALTLVKNSLYKKKIIYLDQLPSSKSNAVLDERPVNVIF